MVKFKMVAKVTQAIYGTINQAAILSILANTKIVSSIDNQSITISTSAHPI
jgi:hypothetical protein